MQRERLIAVIAIVALLSVIAAGAVAAAGNKPGSQSNDPIALYGGDVGSMQSFALRNQQNEATLSISTESLEDFGGTIVGNQYWQCINSSLAWHCSSVITLTDTAASGAGTITLEGLFDGFNGERLAVTGGTGAYASAEGSVELSLEGDRLVRKVDLAP